MSKRVVIAIGLDYIKNQLQEASKNLDFMDVLFFEKSKISLSEREKTLEYIKENANALMIGNITADEDINNFFKELKNDVNDIPIIPIGTEILENGLFNIDAEDATKIIRYFTFGGLKNITNSLYYIGYKYLKIDDCEKYISEPEFVPFDGIFHRDTEKVFNSFESYAKWYLKDKEVEKHRWVGILTHRHNWNSGNIEVEKTLIKYFEALGLKVVPVFSYASAEESAGIKDFSGIISEFFSVDGKLIIDGLVNLQMIAAVSNSKSGNIFEQAVAFFKEMDVPVFRPLISHMQDKETWSNNISGLLNEIAWSFTTPEMIGVIEPIIIGCRGKSGKYEPIDERVDRFTKRVWKWIDLKNTENNKKRLALVIHNAPCAGVEATIGLGAGMDVFESVLRILKELKTEGYYIENMPESSEKLHEMIMERKAYHDFRWTCVEDIVKSGGAIYQMPLKEYMEFYKYIDEDVLKKIEDTWGEPPGAGMVYDNNFIITGVEFGNITVMVQPKRGCYGAKCTGEVCKMLHDTECPPPHQYIATYKYIERVMKANAVIHVGTGGSLEYLPGKTNALSNKCYPDIVLGTIPNVYVYNAGIGGEGIVTKRRNSAVIIDYLPACMSIDMENSKTVNLILNYIEAYTLNSRQRDILKQELDVKINNIKGAEEIVNSEDSFIDGVIKLKDYLVQSINNSKMEKLHVLGQVPSIKENASYIKEYLDNNSKSAAEIRKKFGNEYLYNTTIMELIALIITEGNMIRPKNSDIEKELLDELKFEVIDVFEKLLLVEGEMINLKKVLKGGFIEPGLSGIPSESLETILPTGRNFYLMDCEKIPTREAYGVGCKLAEELIEKYLREEGKYPEKVAMSMISTDISMSKGEQLSQILYLMGITPVWESTGKVSGIEVIPLEKLMRPRIDVTVRISGILRDAYPDAVSLIDKAAVSASSLEESVESNYIKKNTLETARVLKELGRTEDIERRSTIRVFGDRPGTYGIGVDLALKASAWKNEKDIAKIFVYFSSYAYGENLNGCKAKHEFVENVKSSDVSYEITNTNRYDLLTSSFSASVHGGFGVMKRVLSGKEMKQYHGSTENKNNLRVVSTKEEIEKTLNETLFNPLWKENFKEKGYVGASEFMKKIQNIFSWQCLSRNIDDKNIDKLVDIYTNDEKMFEWFNKYNKYAAEEISRRFLELHERKRWNPNKDILDKLRKNYAKIEGDMEEMLENSSSEIQGGTIEVLNQEDIESWKDKLKEVDDIFDK